MRKMKQRILLPLMGLFLAHGTLLADNYNLTVNLKGLPEGTLLELTPVTHDKEKPLATATLQGGKATFTGEVSEPLCAAVRVKDAYGSMQLMVGGETASFTATATESKAADGVTIYNFEMKEMSGSPLTEKLQRLTAPRDSLNRVREAFEKRYSGFHARYAEAHKAGDTKKMEELKASDEYKQMEKEDTEFFNGVEKAYTKVITDNKETFWGPLLLVNLTSYLTPSQRPAFEEFSETAKSSYYGKKVRKELYPAGSVGQKAPSFTVSDEAGQQFTLEQLLAGKRYLLIDFWASWCRPCRMEIPNVKAQYELYKEKGLQVVSISIDKNAEAWRKAVKEEALVWPNFLDPKVADAYSVRAIPALFLLDSEGRVIAEGEAARGTNLAQKLKELFKE